jgi:NAD(P)-dependent dehydrogenase (short-subunit alcohol dehydrogenase family)
VVDGAVPGLLRGDVAVVTGAAQGNGAAIARGLAASGASVITCDLNAAGAASTAAAIIAANGRAAGIRLDVADREACFAAAECVAEIFGDVSILVNNAGITRRTPPDDPAFLDHLDEQIAINVRGCANMAVALLPQLSKSKGRIINIGSIACFVAYRNSAAYAASKGAVKQLTTALAADLAARDIRVNGIAPGVIATPMTEATRADPEAIGRFLGHTPMGRVGEPEELVGPVVFLASRLSSYVSGVMLPVDGGYLTS